MFENDDIEENIPQDNNPSDNEINDNENSAEVSNNDLISENTDELSSQEVNETFSNNSPFATQKNIDTSEETVTVQPVRFASFDDAQNASGEANKNLDNLLDIKLQLTVELGRTTLPIKKVLELTRGSIIELDKIAGEPVDLFANGKLIAHGEVVVIEDNFGLRITSMTEPENRLNALQ